MGRAMVPPILAASGAAGLQSSYRTVALSTMVTWALVLFVVGYAVNPLHSPAAAYASSNCGGVDASEHTQGESSRVLPPGYQSIYRRLARGTAAPRDADRLRGLSGQPVDGKVRYLGVMETYGMPAVPPLPSLNYHSDKRMKNVPQPSKYMPTKQTVVHRSKAVTPVPPRFNWKTETPVWTCPPDYAPKDGRCVARKTATPVPSCPGGKPADKSGKCFVNHSVPSEPQCPPGTEMDAQVSPPRCVRSEITQPSATCPSGFEQTSPPDAPIEALECTAKSEAHPSPSCADRAYTLTDGGKSCERQIEAVRMESCPRGFSGDATYLLFQTTPIGLSSTDSLQNGPGRGGAVPPALSANPQLTVAIAALQEKLETRGLCGAPVTAPAQVVCPEQTVPAAGLCVREELTAVDETCEQGYTKVDEKSLDPVTGMPKYTVKCVKEDSISIRSVCEGDYSVNDTGNECVNERILAAAWKCPEDFTMASSGECEKILRAAPELVCPDGSPPNEQGDCVVREVILPAVTCPFGYIHNEKRHACVRVDKKDPEQKCDPGFQLRNGQCVRLNKIPPTATCPAGHVYHEDRNICVATKFIPRLVECPEGYKMSPVSGRCLMVERVVPDNMCPENFTLNLESQLCVQTRRADGIPRCPPNTKLQHEGARPYCLNNSSVPARQTCPEGTTLKDKSGMCISTEQARPSLVCEKGWDLEESPEGISMCVSWMYAIPKPECPPGLDFNSAMGLCTAASLAPPTKSKGHAPPPIKKKKKDYSISF
eukprot:GHVT01100792.1.p1 GENE.GHVT01100792.1~~GHVT01100792.1.p1  ORF type:complete len:767 (+),score=78.50 GHVT01100792.1:279-2579(+)